MNHTAVVKGSDFVDKAVRYLNSTGQYIPLVLAEVGNTLGSGSDGTSLEGVLGSALWQVDFSLYSMSITWGGMQWTYERNGTEARILNDTQVLPVQQQALDLKVHASEAVMVFLQNQ